MKRYPKIQSFDHEPGQEIDGAGTIVVTEKLDGANFRFTYSRSDGFTFGSRNTVGDALSHDQFRETIDFINDECDRDALLSVQDEYGQLVVFGEAMVPHRIDYDWEQTPPFVGFDVWNVGGQTFHSTEQSKELMEDIGLPFTPVVDTIPASGFEEWDPTIPQSAYYDGQAEGVVLKNHVTGTYWKIVRDAFKEKQHLSSSDERTVLETERPLSDTERIVTEYVTPARVESVAHQLVDDGRWSTIEFPMMRILPKAVIRDTMTEDGGTLVIEEDIELNTSEFRSLVSKRCSHTLREMVEE